MARMVAEAAVAITAGLATASIALREPERRWGWSTIATIRLAA